MGQLRKSRSHPSRARNILGPVRELLLQGEGFRADGIVPFAMEVMADEVDGLEFGVWHLDAGGICVWIELATNLEASVGCGGSDQFDYDLMADSRLAAPVSGN